MCNYISRTRSSKEEIRSDFLDDDPPETPFQALEAIAIDVVHAKSPHLVQLFDDKVFDIAQDAIMLGNPCGPHGGRRRGFLATAVPAHAGRDG